MRYRIRYYQTEHRSIEVEADDVESALEKWRHGAGTDSFEYAGNDQPRVSCRGGGVMTPEYRKAELALSKAYVALNAAAKNLEPYPMDGCCEAPDVKLEEQGYGRWTSMRVEQDDDGPQYLLALGDGWDDMSEGGRGDTVVVCFGCDKTFRIPDDTDVEWA